MGAEISLLELRSQIPAKIIEHHKKEVQTTIEELSTQPSFNTPDGVLLASITDAMPSDAIEETSWTFTDVSKKIANYPERFLAVAAATTLFNLFDAYLESNPAETYAENIMNENIR